MFHTLTWFMVFAPVPSSARSIPDLSSFITWLMHLSIFKIIQPWPRQEYGLFILNSLVTTLSKIPLISWVYDFLTYLSTAHLWIPSKLALFTFFSLSLGSVYGTWTMLSIFRMDGWMNYSISALMETELMVSLSLSDNSLNIWSQIGFTHSTWTSWDPTQMLSPLGSLLVRLHHLLVWLPQSTMHVFYCFIIDLNGVYFLWDFKILKTKAMASLYNEIERGK